VGRVSRGKGPASGRSGGTVRRGHAGHLIGLALGVVGAGGQLRSRLDDLHHRPGAAPLEVRVLPGVGHALVDPETGWVSRAALDLLTDWILEAADALAPQ